MSPTSNDLSPVLEKAAAGDAKALLQLGDSLYGELHRLAERTMATERRDHTLQPSGLVHEAYLRMIHQRNLPVDHRSKFMAMAAGAMRRILVDYARARNAQKRGGGQERQQFDIDELGLDERSRVDVLAVHEALNRLVGEHDRAARGVEMRFFAGMSNEEIAQELGVSTKTVQNDWIFAKAWLYRAMDGDKADDTNPS